VSYGAASFVGLDAFFVFTAPLNAGDEADLEEKASLRLVKRKMVISKLGWLDAQGKVHQRNFDRHKLF
jgi:hypothetical protein